MGGEVSDVAVGVVTVLLCLVFGFVLVALLASKKARKPLAIVATIYFLLSLTAGAVVGSYLLARWAIP